MPTLLLTAASLFFVQADPGAPEPERRMLFDFAEDSEPWFAINDGVMGGLSEGGMRVEKDVAVFTGEVSLENNGGFASVRSRPEEHDLSDIQAVILRVRGGGERYKFRLRTSRAWDGVSYQAEFQTKDGEWTEARLPLDAFRPVFRGRYLEDVKPLDPAEVKTFGLLISDKQEGSFRLEIDWIAGELRD